MSIDITQIDTFDQMKQFLEALTGDNLLLLPFNSDLFIINVAAELFVQFANVKDMDQLVGYITFKLKPLKEDTTEDEKEQIMQDFAKELNDCYVRPFFDKETCFAEVLRYFSLEM